MSRVLSSHIGTMNFEDMKAINAFYGRDFLPYPFMVTQRSRFETRDELLAYTTLVPDRFNHGDLRVFKEPIRAYGTADISVACHIQYIPNDTPSLRVLAWRTDQLGFFAAQRPDVDLIDIYTVSPYDLSTAICDALPLTEPGQHPEILIPEYVPRDQAQFDGGDFALRHRPVGAEVRIPSSEVTAYSTVQSHWRPTRQWGVDRGKRAIVWVRIHDDGEYMYVPGQSTARPMTKAALREQTDLLIADDIEALREFRLD
jgi:EspG family